MTGNHTELVLMSVCSSSQFNLQLSLKMRQLHLCVYRFNEDLGSAETARGIHQNQNLVVPVRVYATYALAQCWMTNLQKSLCIHCKCSLVFWPNLLIWSSCLEVWYNKSIFIHYLYNILHHGFKICHFTKTRLLDLCSNPIFLLAQPQSTLWLRSAGSARNLPTSVRMA